VKEQVPENPELEPLTRTQVLIAMGVTAIVLLVVAKLWMQLGSIALFPFKLLISAIPFGVGLGLFVTVASSLVYRVWPAYRQSADYYLHMVLKPLLWTDLIWLGLLPGLSEELLFRGVMIPAFGFNAEAVILSSICFGVLHLSHPKQWAYVVWATIVGAMLGASALVTGNLLVPILAHVTTNLASSIFWKWGDRQKHQPNG
jgi:membrane protease YdiL (CAAX protease family)